MKSPFLKNLDHCVYFKGPYVDKTWQIDGHNSIFDKGVTSKFFAHSLATLEKVAIWSKNVGLPMFRKNFLRKVLKFHFFGRCCCCCCCCCWCCCCCLKWWLGISPNPTLKKSWRNFCSRMTDPVLGAMILTHKWFSANKGDLLNYMSHDSSLGWHQVYLRL